MTTVPGSAERRGPPDLAGRGHRRRWLQVSEILARLTGHRLLSLLVTHPGELLLRSHLLGRDGRLDAVEQPLQPARQASYMMRSSAQDGRHGHAADPRAARPPPARRPHGSLSQARDGQMVDDVDHPQGVADGALDHGTVHDLAQDCVNQGGISNLRTIHPPDVIPRNRPGVCSHQYARKPHSDNRRSSHMRSGAERWPGIVTAMASCIRRDSGR